MTNRIHKFRSDTIGNRPCEITLGNILAELGDTKVSNAVMRRYNFFKSDIKNFRLLFENGNKDFAIRMLNLWKDNMYKFWERRASMDDVPKEVYTFLICCMNAEYKEFIKQYEKDI